MQLVTIAFGTFGTSPAEQALAPKASGDRSSGTFARNIVATLHSPLKASQPTNKAQLMKTATSKTLLFLTLLLLPFASAFSDDNSFLTVGKHYSVTYLVPDEQVSLASLPRTVTILKEGPEHWYFVGAADGRDYRLWINFSGVLSFTEMPAGFDPSEKPRKLIK